MRGHGLDKDGQPLWWKMISRNKRTLGLYLGDPDGARIFKRASLGRRTSSSRTSAPAPWSAGARLRRPLR